MNRVAAIGLMLALIGMTVGCPTTPNDPAPETGACCLADGSCVDTTSDDCSSMGGTFNEGQACAGVTCQQPAPASGACCLDDGSCVDSDEDECNTFNGTFYEGEDCADVDCPQPPTPIGACCLINGSCVVVDEIECGDMGGTFNEGQTCGDVTCPAPSVATIIDLAEELESVMREDLDAYIHTVSIVGREYWNLNDVEPAYNGELLGKDGAELDPNGFLTTRTFAARYKTVRHAATLITATENADDASLTDQQENALIGYAKTIQSYALLLVANHQFSNGIIPADAIDDLDPNDSFIDYTASLQHIAELLDEGATNLTNGGSSFGFNLSNGFSGFTTPATFRQFNRALSARVRIYQGDKAGSISGIAGSFFNINGAMNTGPKHSYGIVTRNPMYYEPDVDLFTVHPDFLADSDAGDLRVFQKTRAYVATPDFFVPVVVDGLVGDTQVSLVNLDSDPFPIIKNEELILIYAEAQIGSDVNESLAAINRVRNAAGLGNYLGATDDASMLNEVLKQRRYSLFGEGHRWIDLRRTGKFGQINVDRAGDVVHQEFPIPGPPTLSGI